MNKVIGKVADIGISGAAKYKTSEYQGVLQKDLAVLLQKSSDCKFAVWEDLKDKLLGLDGEDAGKERKIDCSPFRNNVLLTSSGNGLNKVERFIDLGFRKGFHINYCIPSPNNKRISVHVQSIDTYVYDALGLGTVGGNYLVFVNIDGSYRQSVEFNCPRRSNCAQTLKNIIWYSDDSVQIFFDSNSFPVEVDGHQIDSKGHWFLHLDKGNTLSEVTKRK